MTNRQLKPTSVLPKWGIINAFFTSIGRLTQIEGRAGRIEYWCIQFIPIFTLLVLLFIPASVEELFIEAPPITLFCFCLQCLIFIAAFSVAIRRLHDIGQNEIYLAAGIFLILSSSWFFNIQAGYVTYITLSVIIGCIPGMPVPNKYGEMQLPALSPSPYGAHWNLANTYKSCMKRKFQISGRSCCSEYAIFCLIYTFMCTVPSGIMVAAYMLSEDFAFLERLFVLIVISIISTLLILYLLFLTIALISLTIRRIHDSNHSGFILLAWLIVLFTLYPLLIYVRFNGSLLLLMCAMLILAWCKITQILLSPGKNSRNSFGWPSFPPV